MLLSAKLQMAYQHMKVKDEAGNIKTIHCNWLFLEPLGAGTSISEENVA